MLEAGERVLPLLTRDAGRGASRGPERAVSLVQRARDESTLPGAVANRDMCGLGSLSRVLHAVQQHAGTGGGARCTDVEHTMSFARLPAPWNVSGRTAASMVGAHRCHDVLVRGSSAS
eukprot:15446651-Alexandrium_andersonii.AAC.1